MALGACLPVRWSAGWAAWLAAGQLFRSQDNGGRRARCVSAGKGGDEVREHEGAEADAGE